MNPAPDDGAVGANSSAATKVASGSARESLFGRFIRLMNVAGTCMVLVIMLVILVDIGGRFLLSRPLTGTPEIVAMSIAVIVYLQFPSTLRAGRVISADGLLDWVGKRSVRWEQWILALHHLAGGLMFMIASGFVVPLVVRAWGSDDFYGTTSMFAFPKWPVLGVIAFGCGMMALQYFILTAQLIGAGRRGVRLIEIDPATKALS